MHQYLCAATGLRGIPDPQHASTKHKELFFLRLPLINDTGLVLGKSLPQANTLLTHRLQVLLVLDVHASTHRNRAVVVLRQNIELPIGRRPDDLTVVLQQWHVTQNTQLHDLLRDLDEMLLRPRQRTTLQHHITIWLFYASLTQRSTYNKKNPTGIRGDKTICLGSDAVTNTHRLHLRANI